MATSKIPFGGVPIYNITTEASATIDEHFINIANAVANRSEGKPYPFVAVWTNHDLFIGLGVLNWGTVTLFMAQSGKAYSVGVNISSQTVSFKNAVTLTSI